MRYRGEQVINNLWITSNQELEALAADLTGSILAIDTEFTRRTTYYAKLALVQIASGERRVLIDPLKISDWQPLRDLFVSAETNIFHAALEDLEVFRKDVGALPEPLFDTQIAASFLNYPLQISYQSLTESLENVRLEKKFTRFDWKKRPLPADVLQYAIDDLSNLFWTKYK